MLTVEENAMLTQTNPKTPMGEVFRSYWQPTLLSRELPRNDCPPVRVKLLNEDFVAFRDSEGKVGIVSPRCPHRGADLFFGRNEQCGLRCVYHGWKFDIHGNCIEVPNAEASVAERLKKRATIRSLPTQEWGDIIWAYMGTGEPPELPQFEFAKVPPEHRFVSKKFQQCNWAQACEGGLDTAHFSFLHAGMNEGERVGLHQIGMTKEKRQGQNEPDRLARFRWMIEDPAPRFTVLEHDAGLLLCAARNSDTDNSYWRMTQFLMPNHSLAPGNLPDDNNVGNTWVPVDDESCWIFCFCWNPDRPLTEKEKNAMASGSGIFAEVDEKYIPIRRRENNYLLDRDLQDQDNYTGIQGISEQDQAIADSQGYIANRTDELLVQTDLGVVKFRQAMLKAIDDTRAGRSPQGVRNPEAYFVRSGDSITPPNLEIESVVQSRFGGMWGVQE